MTGLTKPIDPNKILGLYWRDLVDFLGGETSNPQIDVTKILLQQGGELLNTWVKGDDPDNFDPDKISGAVGVVHGGTGLITIAQGGILYASAPNVLSRIAPSATNQVLRSTGANALEIAALDAADIPNLAATKITSGDLGSARMQANVLAAIIAAGGIVDADVAAAAAIVKSKISTSGRFALGDLPVGTDDCFLRGTGTGSPAYEAIPFNYVGTYIDPNGITAAINAIAWQAPFPCTVTAVRGYRVGGTGATINARKGGSLNHLSSALSLTSADTWMDGGSVQNTAYALDDKLEIMIVSASGSPTQIGIQVRFTRP